MIASTHTPARSRRLLVLLVLAVMFAIGPSVAAQGSVTRERALVDSALQVVDGDAAAAPLRSVRLEGMEHDYLVGNAERADGPWKVFYSRYAELRDFEHERFRRTSTVWSAFSSAGQQGTTVVTDSVAGLAAGGRERPGAPTTVDDARDRMDMGPERALMLARGAKQLERAGVVSLYHEPHDVVAFPWRGGTMRIYLDRYTRLPTVVSLTRAYRTDFRRDPFGGGELRVEYADWVYETSGRWYPHQHITTINGTPLRDLSVYRVTFDAPAPADSFLIVDSVRAQFARAPAPRAFHLGDHGAPTVIRDGIVSLKDFWAMTLVRQNDGIVVFEAHLGPEYAEQVMAEARRQFPGLPIKALILTSDPWAHLGGIREFVARGVPVYLVDASVPFIEHLVRTPRPLDPDLEQRAPKPPRFHAVSGRTVIGTGPNQIVLYPVRGAYSERMLMAYFPHYQLLYGADLVFPDSGGYQRTPAFELRRAVKREGIAVDSVFSVQSAQRYAWDQFQPAPRER